MRKHCKFSVELLGVGRWGCWGWEGRVVVGGRVGLGVGDGVIRREFYIKVRRRRVIVHGKERERERFHGDEIGIVHGDEKERESFNPW